MALVTNTVLGEVTGKLDRYVFRTMNGRTFVSFRPKKYKPNKSILAKQIRGDFATVIKFAKKINSVPGLKEIWKISKVQGSNSFQKIIKNNIKLVKQGELTEANKITPDGIFLKINSASIQDNFLDLSIFFPDNTNVKWPVTLFLVFFIEEDKKNIFVLVVNIETSSQDGLYNLNIKLNYEIQRALAVGPKPIIYAAISGSTPYKNRIYWSCTTSMQL